MEKVKEDRLKRLHELVVNCKELETLLGLSRSHAWRLYKGKLGTSELILDLIAMKKDMHPEYKVRKLKTKTK